MTLQRYDPLEIGAHFRGFSVSSRLGHIDLGGASGSPMVFMPDGAYVMLSFWCADATGNPKPFPPGAYTVGIDLQTAGAPPPGSFLSITDDGATNAPSLKTCPITNGAQTCVFYTNSVKRGMFFLRMVGPGSGTTSQVKKIVFDVPD